MDVFFCLQADEPITSGGSGGGGGGGGGATVVYSLQLYKKHHPYSKCLFIHLFIESIRPNGAEHTTEWGSN